MQSRSLASFKTYKIDRCYSDDLDPSIKGAAFWDKHNGSVGYYVFEPLSCSPLPIEYSEGSCQWVFIALDTRTRNWIAMDTVPQSFRLGRESIRHPTVQAAEADKEETFKIAEEEKTSNIPSSMITNNIYCSAMSQTMSALTLARTASTREQFMRFSRKGKGPAFPPYVLGGGGPSGSGSGGPPGGGPPGGGGGGGGGPPGGGGFFPAGGPGAAGGGGGKLGGKPP